ncbi:DJ-1/PfpI family protein [Bythopirellula polymerisocia]|uniref:Putative cysteine protease YraA n=1 Tax=Bythopirellula polymerisocia TaxID=2528003 RepID=A0A5C6CWG8_9BACT|nr:DJ-1/PfpI family protein [Bythopirellula polymerisocia]TWU27877.1 putative cysteine protease YraA [Bythopirellula polymerisocia]
MEKVLLVIGDGAEVIDTMVPLYRLGEDFQVVKAAPEVRTYHLVQHHHDPSWDVTIETPGYELNSDIAFRDVDPSEYLALVLPGGRAPEFLRYDQELLGITRHFFEHAKPVASICHGIEILAAADVIRGRQVTTIPRCRLDAEFSGATYVAEPLVVDGNLYCCRYKRECSGWMKAFVTELTSRTHQCT